MTEAAELLAEAEQARRYRAEAADFRAAATERYPDSPTEAKELERTAADLILLASSIERRHRGLPPLPPARPTRASRASAGGAGVTGAGLPAADALEAS